VNKKNDVSKSPFKPTLRRDTIARVTSDCVRFTVANAKHCHNGDYNLLHYAKQYRLLTVTVFGCWLWCAVRLQSSCEDVNLKTAELAQLQETIVDLKTKLSSQCEHLRFVSNFLVVIVYSEKSDIEAYYCFVIFGLLLLKLNVLITSLW